LGGKDFLRGGIFRCALQTTRWIIQTGGRFCKEKLRIKGHAFGEERRRRGTKRGEKDDTRRKRRISRERGKGARFLGKRKTLKLRKNERGSKGKLGSSLGGRVRRGKGSWPFPGGATPRKKAARLAKRKESNIGQGKNLKKKKKR